MQQKLTTDAVVSISNRSHNELSSSRSESEGRKRGGRGERERERRGREVKEVKEAREGRGGPVTGR
jgi:hypothetical protein